MNEQLVIVGCGGHGREAFGIARAINEAASKPRWTVVGFVDDSPSDASRARVALLGVPYLGPIDRLGELPGHTRVVIGIGASVVRRDVQRRIEPFGLPTATLVHPSATVASDTVAGEGLLAFAGARVTTNVVLGRHVHLNQNTTVGHDCVLHDYVSINPLAAISGECLVESGALIGSNAVVLQNLRVGRDAVVGAGACVVRHVPAQAIVKGVPAR
jgi:sugar O-acyltransferase (sialic acid O-acetyltransferase NeuD family)